MRVGLQTISWDRPGEDFPTVLRRIKELGYDGVELAQAPGDFPNSVELFDSFSSAGIELVGLSGGGIGERLNFVVEFMKLSYQKTLPYVYADEWDVKADEQYNALHSGDLSFDRSVIVAIHPHMFKPIQSSRDAEKLLEKYDYARFLPDVAHLTVAGEDVLPVLQRYLHSTVGIHLKDWSPAFGRSFPFYSRGFVELGQGVVPIEQIVGFLRQKRFGGWLIVEQDYSADPYLSALKSRHFLRGLGI